MKNKDEEFCRSTFDEYLSDHYDSEERRWEEVPQVEEPPDYFLWLRDEQFAVEVTSLHCSTEVGGRAMPEIQVLSETRATVRHIEESIRQSGFLNGTFALHTRPIENLRSRQAELEEAVLRALQASRSESHTERIALTNDGSRTWYLQKLYDKGQRIYHAGGLSGRLDSKIDEDLSAAFAHLTRTKADKLKAVMVPIVLLILGLYTISVEEHWTEAWMSETEYSRRFHTIARVLADDHQERELTGTSLQILQSDEDHWY